MVLLSHFLEILLKILLWWTVLCTWEYMPTKQSGIWKDSQILVWQSTSPCFQFLSWVHCSEKWLRPQCASRGMCSASCTLSWEWAFRGDDTWWHLSPFVVNGGPGREREWEEPQSQAVTTSSLCLERGWEMLREPQACSSLTGGIKNSLLDVFSL